MTHPLIHYVFAVIVGTVAGFINTLAGAGSAITVPMLMFLGLPAKDANGTNRIGVLMGMMVGAETFRQQGRLSLPGKRWLVGAACAGSLGGAYLASRTPEHVMQWVVVGVMVLMLALIFVKPSQWMREDRVEAANHRRFSTLAIFFAIGAYAGFIQIGAGIFLLAALVLHEHYSLTQSNGLKLTINLAISLLALAVFASQSQVKWSLGLLMGGGQMVGAFFAARFAVRHPQAKVWTQRLLVPLVIVSIFELCRRYLFPS